MSFIHSFPSSTIKANEILKGGFAFLQKAMCSEIYSTEILHFS